MKAKNASASGETAISPSFSLDGKTVLVKFYFTNPNHIPTGIPQKGHPGDEQMDMRHTLRAKDKDLTCVDRVRPGRSDTGEVILENLPMSQAAMLRKGLANNGYALVNAVWFKKTKENKPPKFVVELTFKHGAKSSVEFSRRTSDAIRKLAKTLWFCWIWRNEGEKTLTVNFVGLQQGTKPSFTIAARNGCLNVEAAFAFAEEEDE